MSYKILLGAVLSIAALGANAATCTSSGTVGPKVVTASLASTVSDLVGSAAGDGCTAMAQGNLDNMGPITVFGETWYLIQSDVEANDGSSGALTLSDTSGDAGDSRSGTWSIDLSQTGSYDTFVVGLKPDGGFVYYNVGDETSGTYGSLTDEDDLSHGLSHANLYGMVSEVPVPAAAWLFGSALIGLAGLTRKRA